uniref:Uncharacterized protein n=1 Tax=Siphoviridae sp. ctREU2 TaxID=2826333 RepID=A0A8S5NKJ0_9CAUD|nr:MAG TPA: hypothetical protein [Siphoviridae sp. ctREU2]
MFTWVGFIPVRRIWDNSRIKWVLLLNGLILNDLN